MFLRKNKSNLKLISRLDRFMYVRENQSISLIYQTGRRHDHRVRTQPDSARRSVRETLIVKQEVFVDRVDDLLLERGRGRAIARRE